MKNETYLKALHLLKEYLLRLGFDKAAETIGREINSLSTHPSIKELNAPADIIFIFIDRIFRLQENLLANEEKIASFREFEKTIHQEAGEIYEYACLLKECNLWQKKYFNNAYSYKNISLAYKGLQILKENNLLPLFDAFLVDYKQLEYLTPENIQTLTSYSPHAARIFTALKILTKYKFLTLENRATICLKPEYAEPTAVLLICLQVKNLLTPESREALHELLNSDISLDVYSDFVDAIVELHEHQLLNAENYLLLYKDPEYAYLTNLIIRSIANHQLPIAEYYPKLMEFLEPYEFDQDELPGLVTAFIYLENLQHASDLTMMHVPVKNIISDFATQQKSLHAFNEILKFIIHHKIQLIESDFLAIKEKLYNFKGIEGEIVIEFFDFLEQKNISLSREILLEIFKNNNPISIISSIQEIVSNLESNNLYSSSNLQLFLDQLKNIEHLKTAMATLDTYMLAEKFPIVTQKNIEIICANSLHAESLAEGIRHLMQYLHTLTILPIDFRTLEELEKKIAQPELFACLVRSFIRTLVKHPEHAKYIAHALTTLFNLELLTKENVSKVCHNGLYAMHIANALSRLGNPLSTQENFDLICSCAPEAQYIAEILSRFRTPGNQKNLDTLCAHAKNLKDIANETQLLKSKPIARLGLNEQTILDLLIISLEIDKPSLGSHITNESNRQLLMDKLAEIDQSFAYYLLGKIALDEINTSIRFSPNPALAKEAFSRVLPETYWYEPANACIYNLMLSEEQDLDNIDKFAERLSHAKKAGTFGKEIIKGIMFLGGKEKERIINNPSNPILKEICEEYKELSTSSPSAFL
jgi:hypothetical protein